MREPAASDTLVRKKKYVKTCWHTGESASRKRRKAGFFGKNIVEEKRPEESLQTPNF